MGRIYQNISINLFWNGVPFLIDGNWTDIFVIVASPLPMLYLTDTLEKNIFLSARRASKTNILEVSQGFRPKYNSIVHDLLVSIFS